MTKSAATTTEQSEPRKRRQYISREAESVPFTVPNPKAEKVKRLAASPGTPGEGEAAKAALKRLGVGPELIVLRNRRDWANDDEHARKYAGHLALCPVCRRLFDTKVNPGTGSHHERRPSEYCSDACQNRAKHNRAEYKRAVNEPRLGPTSHDNGEPTAMTDLRSILQSVVLQLTRNGGWSPLRESEWDVLTREAPEAARLLRYHESAERSRDITDAFIQRNGRARADLMRDEVVAAIQTLHNS